MLARFKNRFTLDMRFYMFTLAAWSLLAFTALGQMLGVQWGIDPDINYYMIFAGGLLFFAGIVPILLFSILVSLLLFPLKKMLPTVMVLTSLYAIIPRPENWWAGVAVAVSIGLIIRLIERVLKINDRVYHEKGWVVTTLPMDQVWTCLTVGPEKFNPKYFKHLYRMYWETPAKQRKVVVYNNGFAGTISATIEGYDESEYGKFLYSSYDATSKKLDMSVDEKFSFVELGDRIYVHCSYQIVGISLLARVRSWLDFGYVRNFQAYLNYYERAYRKYGPLEHDPKCEVPMKEGAHQPGPWDKNSHS